ncbi:MAG: metal ABC transporter permease [bacterium]|nr:metal ABC transporter permease [bacterium]
MDLLTYPFFLRAVIAAVLASVICGIIGTYIVSKRLVFIGGGITHASFGGIGIGYYLGLNPLVCAALFAVASAFGIEFFSKQSRMRVDSLIGIGWSLGMAIGIIFIFITPGYSDNLMGYLFGSILTVSWTNIGVMIILTAIIILFFTLYYKEILYIAFDEEYAITQGVPVKIFNYILLGLIALTIVLTIRVVGVILVISLLTIPQAAAGLFTNDFKRIIFYSIGAALASCLMGLSAAHYLDISPGASIILSSVVIFVLLKLIQLIVLKTKKD